MNEDRAETLNLERVNATFVEVAIHLGLVAFLLYWSFTLVQPFAPIVVWSVVLTVALYPIFDELTKIFRGRRRLAAAVITLLGLAVVIGPVTWLGLSLVDAVRALVSAVNSGKLSIPPPSETVKEWPLIGQQVYDFWAQASTNLRSTLAPFLPQLQPFGEFLIETAGNASLGTLKFLFSVIIAGFLFSPAPMLLSSAKAFARKVHTSQGERFVDLAGATIRAVSRGVIGLSLVQAVVAAIGMTMTGVPGASLLTVAVLALGIVQVGPMIVVLPVLIWGWSTMPTGSALVLTACMAVVGAMDNFVKPFALSHGLKTPMLVTFIGVIGGVIAHGIGGLFVGPVVLAVVWELAMAWIHDVPPESENADAKAI